jgi:beta-lactamase class A
MASYRAAMERSISRRSLLLAGLAVLATGPQAAAQAAKPVEPSAAADGPVARLMALERASGGRLGVAVLDSAGGRRLNHRGEQRFALCSTFKLLAAALVLARHDRGEERLERRIMFDRDDLVPYSPATEAHAGVSGMTLAELCEAAVVVSDNTAGNLLLASFGGPPALTAFARTLGDRATRLDRIEPALNENLPEDPRDTTTPAGMLASLQALLLGDALRAESRARLLDWLLASTTGARRLRAGVPADWQVAGKTGTGMRGATNEIALLRPSHGRAPLLVAAYYDGPDDATQARHEAVIAEVGRIVASMVAAGSAT